MAKGRKSRGSSRRGNTSPAAAPAGAAANASRGRRWQSASRAQRKTGVCLHFLAGRCTYGASCRFAHGEVSSPLAPAAAAAAAQCTPVRGNGKHGRRKGKGGRRRKGKRPSAAAPAPAVPPPPPLLHRLCDDNLCETLAFLSVPDLGCAAATCAKWRLLQSTTAEHGRGGPLWHQCFARRFHLPSPRWSATLELAADRPATAAASCKPTAYSARSQTDWKHMVRVRSEVEQRWRREAGFDHGVHGGGRQTLRVGVGEEFATLGAAVQVASAFDCIVVGPGDYTDETLRVAKTLEILGATPAATTAVRAAAAESSDEGSDASSSPPPSGRPRHLASPVSVVAAASPAGLVRADPLDPTEFATATCESTFPAVLGKVSVAPGAKVRFSRLAFGGDDSVFTFPAPSRDERRRRGVRKTWVQYDECSFLNSMFVFEAKPPALQVGFARCVLVACDTVRTAEPGPDGAPGHAVLRPFSPDDDVADEESPTNRLATFRNSFLTE